MGLFFCYCKCKISGSGHFCPLFNIYWLWYDENRKLQKCSQRKGGIAYDEKMAKWLSCFLTVCMMVTSLPIYQTAAHAETTDKNEEEQEPQQDTVSGLGITWDMNWDGEEPAVNDGAEFEKEVWWGDLQGTYQFKSFDADGQVQKIITADKLQLYNGMKRVISHNGSRYRHWMKSRFSKLPV